MVEVNSVTVLVRTLSTVTTPHNVSETICFLLQLSEDGNRSYPKRYIVFCIVTMEGVVININDRTDFKPFS
jgi:hypothetical protein